jgi:MFS transporter, DHA1 family, multidrug resistance protein
MSAAPAQPLPEPAATSVRHVLRGLMRRDVVSVCLVIFSADLVSGILSPTFSLYAQNLGASLTFIGTLSSILGITQLFTSMPIGVLSDRYGRKIVLALGMVSFAAATTLFALAPTAAMLIPGRILMGLASVSTFTIGAAYVGDVVTTKERGLALGLYATSMGMGFGIGPLIGPAIALPFGVPASYIGASVLALGGATLAVWGLAAGPRTAAQSLSRSLGMVRRGFAQMLHDPRLLGGSVCNLLINTGFGGAISNFFPIYAANNLASPQAINSMFSVRALSSALARLPSGAITSRLPSRAVMVSALLLAMTAILFMSRTNALVVLSLLLVVEGVAYGVFMPAGQAFTAEHSTPATRGQIVGAYGTAGSLGSALSPLVLGLVAQAWGVAAVFTLTAILLGAGLLLAVILFRRPTPIPRH